MEDNTLILSRKNLSTISFALGFPIGAAHETLGGISEVLTSHLLRNTASMDEREFANHLDRHGIQTFDNVTKTGIWIGLNTPPQNLDVALDIFEDLLLNPEFKEDTIMKIVQQQKGNIKQLDQLPQFRLFQRTRWESAFGDSRVAKSFLGTEEDLDKIDVESLHEYHEDLLTYQPEFVSVGVGTDESQFESTINRFADLGNKKPEVNLRGSGVKPLNSQVDKMMEQTKNAYIGINLQSQGYNGTNYEDVVFKNILSGGVSSRMFREIREERNLSYSTFALNSKFDDFGLITVGMDIRPDKAEEGRDVALEIMKDVLTKEIPEGEMRRALKVSQRTALFVSDSSQSYTGWLMGRRLHGREWDLDKVNQAILNASELDWQETMFEYWKRENFSLGVAGEPGKVAETWEDAVEKVL